MKRILANFKTRMASGAACLAVAAMCWNGATPCQAQAPANLSPGLQDVVGLAKAQMGDDVIIKYIHNAGKTYSLSADDMMYLKAQGVSSPVISALLEAKAADPAPVPPPDAPPQGPPPGFVPPPAPPGGMPPGEAPPPAAPGPEINFAYFHDQLAPFGSWVDVGGVMYWHPDQAVAANPDWRPYYDMGQWVQTDNGLFWQSDYTWGDIPFHYGRWIRQPGYGWLWAPDYTWGPAWVFWRHAEQDAAIGWAPLPVGAVFVADGGYFLFNGARVGLDFEFGLGESCFTFVGYDHFHEGFFRMRGREYAYHIHGDRFHDFYRRSVVRNEFRRDEHGRFVNNGIGRDRLDRATHGRVERTSFEERHPVGDRNQLAKGGEKSGGKSGEKSGARTGGPEKSGKTGSAGASKVFRPPATSSRTTTSSKTTTTTPSSNSKKK